LPQRLPLILDGLYTKFGRRRGMKSVTIRNKQGKILVKIIHRKSGVYDLIKTPEIDRDCDIEVRADDNSKVIFGGWDG